MIFYYKKKVLKLSETEIYDRLRLDASRKIFETCMYIPKSAKEIEELTGLSSRDVAEDLKILERLEAIQLLGGKWIGTSFGKKTWLKYFGEPP